VLLDRWWSSGRPERRWHWPLPAGVSGLQAFAEWAVGAAGLSPVELTRIMGWSTKGFDELLAG